MTLTVLAATGLLACVFYLYVLFRWIRDPRRKGGTRPATDRQVGGAPETKRPYVIRSQKTADKHRPGLRSHGAPRLVELSRGAEPEWNAIERIAYQKIAGSLRKRS
jgi:hypothetical protein